MDQHGHGAAHRDRDERAGEVQLRQPRQGSELLVHVHQGGDVRVLLRGAPRHDGQGHRHRAPPRRHRPRRRRRPTPTPTTPTPTTPDADDATDGWRRRLHGSRVDGRRVPAARLRSAPRDQRSASRSPTRSTLDQYLKTHLVLVENMLKPLLGGAQSTLDTFLQHVYAAHLETGLGQQVADALRSTSTSRRTPCSSRT